MSTQVEDTLADAVERVRSGRSSIEEALLGAPAERAAELEPLLALAAAIVPPAHAAPSPEFRRTARARLFNAMAAEGVTDRPTPRTFRRGGPLIWWGRPLLQGRLSVPAVVLAALLTVGVVTGGGAAYAAQSSLPGDLLYPVKTGLDQASVALARGDEARAAAYLTLAERRLGEAEALVRAGRWEEAAIPGDEARRALLMTGSIVDRLTLAGADPAELRARLEAALARYAALAPAPAGPSTTPEPQPTPTQLPSATPAPSPTPVPSGSFGAWPVSPGPTGTPGELPGRWEGPGPCPDCQGWGPGGQDTSTGSWSGPWPYATPDAHPYWQAPVATPGSSYPMDGQRWATPSPTGARTWSTPNGGWRSGPGSSGMPRSQPTRSAPRPTSGMGSDYPRR